MSSKRNLVLTEGETYHILNRSIAKEDIFTKKTNLRRALNLIDYYRFPQKLSYSKYLDLPTGIKKHYEVNFRKQNPIIEIFAFAFMPDHFHFLLKQLKVKGISIFLSNFQNAFAKYFNLKEARDGGLFKRPFRAKWVDTDEKFLHISRYIHLNPVTSYIIEIKDLKSYPWTSYTYYLSESENSLVNTKFLLKQLGKKDKYVSFVNNQVDYQRKLHKIKKLTLE